MRSLLRCRKEGEPGNKAGREVIAAILILSFLLLTLDSWRIWTDYKNTLRDATINLENMVRLIAEQTESTIELTDTLLATNVQNMESARLDTLEQARIHTSLITSIKLSTRMLAISILDAQGNWLINSTATPPDFKQNFTDREYFQFHRDHADQGLHIGAPVKRKTNGQWAISLSRRWNKPDGSFGGVIVAAVALDYFHNFFMTLNVGSNGVVALHREDGIVLARRPYAEENVGKSVAKGEMFSRYLPLSTSGTYRIRSLLDGQERLASYRRLPKFPIVASSAFAMHEVLAPWHYDLYTHIVGLSVLFCIFLLLSLRLLRQMNQRAQAELALRKGTAIVQNTLASLTETEQRLRENQHFLASLLDSIPGMVAYWNKDLSCRFANWFYLDWYGKDKMPEQEIRLQDFLGETLFEQYAPRVRAVLAGEAQHFELTLSKPDGEMRHTWANYLPDGDGENLHGFLVLISDVTELKLGQLKLERLNEELNLRTQQAESANIAKSQFLANMSHEIRTPMNAVLGMLQLLANTSLTAQQQDYVAKGHMAGKALLAIINDILDFSKVEAGKMLLEARAFHIKPFFRELAIILLSSVGSKDIKILFDIDPRIPACVIGDALRMQQILLNLAGNAVKFTEQGEVAVSARLAYATADGVTLDFSIRDTGIGIDPQQLSHIFAGFSQAEASTTRRFGGTGLGLAISQRLVELMGGRLQVESKLGAGSRFFYSLAFKTAEAPASLLPRRPAPATSKRLQGLRLLLVEDNILNQQVALELLSNEGAIVAVADHGQRGIDLLMSSSPAFDAILMDVQMPVMDGYTTARKIRSLPGMQALPIIAITANSAPSDRDACFDAGMSEHVSKPFDMNELTAVIRKHTHQAGVNSSGLASTAAANAQSLPTALVTFAMEHEIDVASVLERFSGHLPTISRVLQIFESDMQQLCTQIPELLEQDKRDELERVLHTLKGTAATVGARQLAAQARHIEAQLHAGLTLQTQRAGLLHLSQTLHEKRFAIQQLAARFTQISAPPAAEPSDDQKLQDKLDKLMALLNDSNLEALALFSQLHDALSELAPTLSAELDDAVNRLDFTAAHRLCADLVQFLKENPYG